MRRLTIVLVATLLAGCTPESAQPSPTADEVIHRGDEVVTVYRGSNWDGVYGFRSECPPGTKKVNGGGADKYSGSGHLDILGRGHDFRSDGRLGWIEEIEVGPGPLEVFIKASC